MAGASNNGGWASDGGSPDDLPDLPEEWGVIVIPDDLSELTDEVEAIRAELHLVPPTRWQRFLRRPAGRRLHRAGAAALRAPVLIISLAVLVTVASLFASAWPGPPRQPATQRTAGTTPDGRVGILPALELFGPDGAPVPIRGTLPAVLMLIDGCACAALVDDTVAVVPRQVAVVTVSGTAASTAGGPPTGAAPPPPGKIVRTLHDPAGTVRGQLELGEPDGTAAVLLVDRAGTIVRTVPRVASVEEIRSDLARL